MTGEGLAPRLERLATEWEALGDLSQYRKLRGADFSDELRATLAAFCVCGHEAVYHHGTDSREGCLGVASHKKAQCPCGLTSGEVMPHA